MQSKPLTPQSSFPKGTQKKTIKAYIIQLIRDFLNIPDEIPQGGKALRSYLKETRLPLLQDAMASTIHIYTEHFTGEFTTHKLYDWAESNGKAHANSFIKSDEQKKMIQEMINSELAKGSQKKSLQTILAPYIANESGSTQNKKSLSRSTVHRYLKELKRQGIEINLQDEAEDHTTQPTSSPQSQIFETRKPLKKGRQKKSREEVTDLDFLEEITLSHKTSEDSLKKKVKRDPHEGSDNAESLEDHTTHVSSPIQSETFSEVMQHLQASLHPPQSEKIELDGWRSIQLLPDFPESMKAIDDIYQEWDHQKPSIGYPAYTGLHQIEENMYLTSLDMNTLPEEAKEDNFAKSYPAVDDYLSYESFANEQDQWYSKLYTFGYPENNTEFNTNQYFEERMNLPLLNPQAEIDTNLEVPEYQQILPTYVHPINNWDKGSNLLSHL